MNQEKGITMITLIITVIILAILIGVGVRTVSPLIGKANAEDLTTELMLIQAKWKVEREKVNFDGSSSLPEDAIETENEEEKGKLKSVYLEQLPENAKTENVTQYYKLTQETLNAMGLEELKEEDGYIVNYENDEIVYLKGIEDEQGNMQYKLSKIKEL